MKTKISVEPSRSRMNQSRPMYGVLSAKSLTGTLWPPRASDRPIRTNAASASQRARLMTTLNSASAPDSTSDQNRSWRMTSTLYDFLSSGVVRYSGKWKASTPRKQSAASIRAITPEAIPLPGWSAPCDSLRRFSLSMCCFIFGRSRSPDGRPSTRGLLRGDSHGRRFAERVEDTQQARHLGGDRRRCRHGAADDRLDRAGRGRRVVPGRENRCLAQDAFLRRQRQVAAQDAADIDVESLQPACVGDRLAFG